MFVITGNTRDTNGIWGGGEAIIRLQSGPSWSGQTTDYWAPTNWVSLDNSDTDLGGVSATMIDVPGATPSQLVLALGKDRNAYLLNRNNLGGISAAVAQANMVSGTTLRGTSVVTYRTSQATYFAFHDDGNGIAAYKITATNPPTIVNAWSMGQSGRGSPWLTTTDGTNNAIVWVVGTTVSGDQRLHGYNGDTGAVMFSGGGANELMTNTRQWNTGIVARGRTYFAADNKVYAFKLPQATPTPTPTVTPTPTPTPTPTATPGITLRARGQQHNGREKAQLSWRRATSTDVDIYRNGTVIVTTANDGSYIDLIGQGGQGSYTYKVCEAGTQTCSNEATITF
jgi:hypothetical protein